MTKGKKLLRDIPTSLSVAKALGGWTLRMYHVRNTRVLSVTDLQRLYKEERAHPVNKCDPACECC